MALPFKKKTATKTELPEKLPEHVAFIMDGNGRWAKKRGMPRKFGHREGAKTFHDMTRYCRSIGIKNISFYVFSTENWKRPKEEIDAIMNLLWEYLNDCDEYLEQEVRMIFIGDKTRLPEKIQKRMIELEEDSKKYNKMNLILAINYGGRDEIAHAAKLIAQEVKSGNISPDEITEDIISDNLYTKGIPDVDLMIRPSGELRLSNFLIWQCAYAEYYFTDILWPDFSREELNKALVDFSERGRRFGGV
ncbi:MAG: isoprenyl transferase [Ruminococcus sp.]|nr:isoprenyl transferase [Ruminococcus sp.]